MGRDMHSPLSQLDTPAPRNDYSVNKYYTIFFRLFQVLILYIKTYCFDNLCIFFCNLYLTKVFHVLFAVFYNSFCAKMTPANGILPFARVIHHFNNFIPYGIKRSSVQLLLQQSLRSSFPFLRLFRNEQTS